MFQNKKLKMLGTLAVVFIVLAVTGITMAVAADSIRFEGTITDSQGVVVSGAVVEIAKNIGGEWVSVGTATTDSEGRYYIPGPTKNRYASSLGNREGEYRLTANGKVEQEYKSGTAWKDDFAGWGPGFEGLFWSCVWNVDPPNLIPEFSTIAVPIATILGLLFFFNRKRRKE